MAIPPVTTPSTIRTALERASDATGADFTLLAETARRESNFNATARAPTSSATGLFQFVEGTWLDMVRRHGADHGLGDAAKQIRLVNGRAQITDPVVRRAVLALRDDPELSARMAGELAKDNAAFLETRLGRAPTNGEIYAAHVLGAGGAAKLIQAAAAGAPDASQIFPIEAKANPWLFADHGAPRSAQSLLDRLNVSGVEAERRVAPVTTGVVDRSDPKALAVLMDTMLQDLVRSWLGGPEGKGVEQTDPMRAAAAYLKFK